MYSNGKDKKISEDLAFRVVLNPAGVVEVSLLKCLATCLSWLPGRLAGLSLSDCYHNSLKVLLMLSCFVNALQPKPVFPTPRSMGCS